MPYKKLPGSSPPGGAFLAVASSSSTFMTVALAVIVVLVLLGLALVSSALGGIFSAAVYCYATTGSTGEFFREDLIKDTFREKASSW